MPQTPTPNMGLVKPTEGGDDGTWDELLDEAIDLVDAHDHTAGKGVKITPAGLNINVDLSFLGHCAINLGAAQFTPVAAASMAGRNRGFWVNVLDNELYFRNNAGTDIKFTTGNTINISVVGGIGGDYSAVGALLSFDDATHRYLAQQQGAPRPWAGIALGNLDIYQQVVGIVNRVRLQSPNALAASYAITLPAALPASAQLLQVDNAGVMTASNVVAQALTCSSTLHVVAAVTLDASCAIGTSATIGTTLGVTGATTLTGGVTNNPSFAAGLTCAVNQDITLSGTGHVKTGNRKRSHVFHPTLAEVITGMVTNTFGAGDPHPAVTPNSDVRWPIMSNNTLERLQSLSVNAFPSGAGAKTVALEKMQANGTMVAIAGASSTGVLGNPVVLTPSVPAALTDGEIYFVRFTTPNGTSAFDPTSCVETYDVP